MSNFDKVVKLACKPKNAPPKDKYINALVSATFQDDGALADISRSLSLRLREPNAVVVFKALLTFHLLLRGGSADNLLSYLSQSNVLRLQNVTNQNWEARVIWAQPTPGYTPPSHLGHYARYLDSRIGSFRELKHDPVSAQNESNRRSTGLGANAKARRLRHLPVEKGLLREVKAVQRILDSLVACQFYDDDIKDENTVMAYRMLIKDLLVLFQAGNEGVCNILEHYFEMSKVDATDAFAIYKSFIKQTDRIVDYLAIARRLQNVVNVPVPNLKHAPTSLVKALEEYLNDPDFEQNRQEYKKSLGVVEGRPGGPSPAGDSSERAAPAAASAPAKKEEAKPQPPPGASQKIQDFFDSIQAEQQPTMFGGPASNNSFSAQQQAQQAQMFQMQQAQMQQQQMFAQQQQHQQQMANPFRQSIMPQQTGFIQPNMTGFPGGPQQPFLPPQATGASAFGNRTSMFQPNGGASFMQPQQTGFMQPGAQPFSQPQQGQQEMLASQPTGFQPSFLQPQATGANPFRQSMLAPIHTGAPHPSGAFSQPASPFHQQSMINRPGSTPAGGDAAPKPLTAQATGSKNPFALGQPAQPTGNKGPSMNQLAMDRFNAQYGLAGGAGQGGGASAQGGQGGGAPPAPSGSFDPFAPAGSGSANGKAGSAMSDIASAFTDTSAPSNPLAQFGGLSFGAPGAPNFASSSSSSPFLQPSQTGSLNGSTGGAQSPPLQPQSTGFLQPQRTGYGGSAVRPFKPTSNFGAGLLETLPPIPEPGASTPTPGAGAGMGSGGLGAQPTGATGAGFPFGAQGGMGATSPAASGGAGQPFGAGAFGGAFGGAAAAASSPGGQAFGAGAGAASPGLSPQKTGFQPSSSFGQQLVAQTTGGNPFRQSTFGGPGGALGAQPTGAGAGAGAFGQNGTFGQNGAFGQNGNGAFGGAFGGAFNQPQPTGAGAFGGGAGAGAGAFGAASPFAGQNRPPAGGSLI